MEVRDKDSCAQDIFLLQDCTPPVTIVHKICHTIGTVPVSLTSNSKHY